MVVSFWLLNLTPAASLLQATRLRLRRSSRGQVLWKGFKTKRFTLAARLSGAPAELPRALPRQTKKAAMMDSTEYC